MDVRCEKCQTEYELDEARLKPGGVTVKCTNCGHMFKIRKRSNTNVGVPATASTPPSGPTERARAPSNRPASAATPNAGVPRADSMLDGSGPTATGEERQWLIRLENGEQKSCRELANLQQWIVAGVVTRESLISRTGKTWKRLGDITELAQYFTIADEARTQRQERQTRETGKPATKPAGNQAQTMLGIGTAPSAQGGKILPDDEDELRSTGNFKTRGAQPTPPPPVPQQARRPPTQPPPPPGSYNKKPPAPAPSTPPPPAEAARSFTGMPAASNRSTAAWATTGDAPGPAGDGGPSGPLGGRIKAAESQEPAFAGRVRVMPSDEDAFRTGPNIAADDDDDVLPARRGSRGGAWLLVMALLVMGAAAGVVYVFVIRKGKTEDTTKPPPSADAGIAMATPDAAVATPPPAVDAAVVTPPPKTPVELAKDELGADNETKLRDALKSLDGVADPGAEAMRAHLSAQIAQGLLDRAAVTGDKTEAEKLKKDAKQLVIDAAPGAQRAFKAAGDDALANLAMAEILRLQGKAAKDFKRYADAAKAKAGDWKRDVALAEGIQLARDGKLEDAKTAFAAIDTGDDKLETSGDVRARFHLALALYAQNKPAEAKPLVAQVLAAQPEHAGAKALATRLETTVVKTDPLPPEENTTKPNTNPSTGNSGGGGEPLPTGGGYDALLARANKLAETSCTKATEVYQKALEQKPNGVEALTGMGYCHIDAKQYSSAFSKFRAALAISSRYEPALWGVAEAYSQQGRKEQAIEAVKAYLEVYPGAPKALKALDRLGGSATPPGPGSADKPPEKPPEKPVETPTAPTPPPDPNGQPQKQPEKAPENGAGSGSG